jgi:hypothetical protein
MHISIVQGRAFRESDMASSTPVAIVSETVARAWWNGKSPIGDALWWVNTADVDFLRSWNSLAKWSAWSQM